MTVLYSDADVGAVLTPELAISALEAALVDEALGNADVPGRLNASAPDGWIRLMPAVIEGVNGDSAMGLKVMNLNRHTGVRYVVLLYDAESGELAAIMDAARLTRIRTAAVTAIACRVARPGPLEALGLLGSGNEAAGHAEVFRAVFPELKEILVYSPRTERRERFAAEMREQLGIEVRACDDPREPASVSVSVLATKAETPVIEASWVPSGALILSIGSTRPDLREVDVRLFERTTICLADAPSQLLTESGDVKVAIEAGCLEADQLISLADVLAGKAQVDWPPDDLLIFKSVGSALQDLAVAAVVHDAARLAGSGTDLAWAPMQHGSA